MCALTLNAQEVQKDFTKTLLSEDFENVSEKWPQIFNADNVFLTQNSHYELLRNSKKSGYYLLPKISDEFSNFEVTTSFIFESKGNAKQSAGILIMAQKSGNGAILVEINRKKEFSIRKIYTDRTVNITSGEDGWEKNSNISKENNEIVIKTYKKVYDVYINGQFVKSFSEIEFARGSIGLYIGPDSKATFDFLKIKGEEKADISQTEVTIEKNEDESFAQIIIKLKDQLNAKIKESEELRVKLKNCNISEGSSAGTDTASMRIRKNLEASNNKLQLEKDDIMLRLAKVIAEKEKLEKFKNEIQANQQDGDIIINLTNLVNSQKIKISDLETKNTSLNEESNSLFLETKDLNEKLKKARTDLDSKIVKNLFLERDLDSLRRQVKALSDTLNRLQKGTVVQETLTEEEKLNQLIEKERLERVKRREDEDKKKKEGE